MEKEKKTITTENVPQIDKSRFELVHEDTNVKIHDAKFETKATTFARDALKRFVKNKSSVVGAVIIGVLLLGSFLSVFSPHNIKVASADETLLPGKVFKAGTGWWDGCTEKKDVAYDDELGQPVGVTKEYCYNIKLGPSQLIDSQFDAAKGGYFVVSADKPFKKATYDLKNNAFLMRLGNYTGFSCTDSDNFKVNIEFGGEADYYEGKEICESYSIGLLYGQTLDYDIGDFDSKLLPLQGKTTEFGNVEINISNKLAENGIANVDNAHVVITALPHVSEVINYVMVKTVVFSSDSTDEETVALLDAISVKDANKTVGYGKSSSGEFPVGYWRSTGYKGVYHATYRTCSYRYDEYSAKFGDRKDFIIGGSIMEQYIAKGWCEFADFSDVSTFKVINEKKCPIKEVTSVFTSPDTDNPWQWKTVTTYYKYKGYTSMPKYIFGTDASGHDLLTVALSSLKTSLLVAIISSAACLIIGLVWGSISGYFGGNVDIIMERITDILGGVPWIIMMTLIILLLGNNIVTFGFALVMTGWIGTASRTRTQFYRFKGREYILASRTLGASDARLIFRHILPNGLGTIVTGSVLMIPSCIFSEASISYLGLGLKGVDSFGVLLSSNQMYLSTRPLLVVVPAIIISLLMISFNLFGNGLRDALNPTLKGGE